MESLRINAEGNALGGGGGQFPSCEVAIISSWNNFYNKMRYLEEQGIIRSRIIDGRVFKVPNLDFPRFLEEGIAYGTFEDEAAFSDTTSCIYPRFYRFENSDVILVLGAKSRINDVRNRPACIDSFGRGNMITFGNFSAISWNALFELGLDGAHNHHALTSYGLVSMDWAYTFDCLPPLGNCRIEIGNDVWIGRGCILKCTNPEHPLIIGDGAVIASDSVVVKSVPPYAIVGGNPAKLIRYRFPPDYIAAFERIKWWNWSIDKIHDNFKYFNDVEKFIAMHDK